MASSNARYDNVDNVSDILSSLSEISEDEIDLSSCEDYCEEIGERALMDRCRHSEQCQYIDENSFCSQLTNQCKCKEGFNANSDQSPKCIPGVRPVTTPDMKIFLVVMVVGLLIVSVFVYFGMARFCERLRSVNNIPIDASRVETAPYSDSVRNPHVESLPPSYTQAVISPIPDDIQFVCTDDAPPPSYEEAIKEETKHVTSTS
ncbi:hypothetical protein GQR58_012516 [Nymphon striatum]|nr:hypothetical protein GQR58_012516 [Nymphon striatum]